MLRKLYDRTMALAGHRHAMGGMAAVSFLESSIFPIPPDVLLIPMVLADREKAWRIALVCTLASVAGGLAGYAIGYFLYEVLAQPILNFYGYGDKFASFQARYEEWGAWIVAGAGLTPFPYKVITIASGVVALNLPVFMIASILSRGLRFFIVAGLLWYYGEPMRQLIERHLGKLATLFFILLLGGFMVIKYVF